MKSLQKTRPFLKINVVSAAIFTLEILLSFYAYAQPMPPFGGGTGLSTKVGMITVSEEMIPLTFVLSGQSTAEENATIKPLVGGVVTDILYKAGDKVEKGTPLFQIEQDIYSAELEAAQAQLENAKAAVPLAMENLKRYEKLSGTGVSRSTVDQARAELRQANANVNSAKAAVKAAQISLDRATIKSPIDGIVDTPKVSIGDLVTAGQSDALTMVTKLDPILVDLAESSTHFFEVRKKIDSGELKKGDAIDATLILENGETYEGKGIIENVGRNVSSSTGTLTVRVRFDNPDQLILPGVFLRARLTLGTLKGFLIPQLAAEPQADGTIGVWTLDKDNKAKEIFLTPQGSTATSWIVTSGLEGEGIAVLVDNTDNLREGATVETVKVQIDEKGIIHDLEKTEPIQSGDMLKNSQ